MITESGLRVYKELMPMKKEQVDWKVPHRIAEVPRKDLARGGISRADLNLGTGNVVVAERGESDWASEDAQDEFAQLLR
jgi:hypothetical protein